MKYLVIERDDIEVAILFPELVQHKEAAKALRPSDRILGAGFCSILNSTNILDHNISPRPSDLDAVVQCWGKSDGLKIASRGTADAAAIRFTLTLPTTQPEEAVWL